MAMRDRNRKKKSSIEYRDFDRSVWKPVLKCSICNGEQVAEFRNTETGEVEEIAYIRSPEELKEFLDVYGLDQIERVY